MTTKFSEIADAAKATWSVGARELYDAALATFEAERAARIAVGSELASARRGSGLTQVELAERSGVDQAEISRVERGASNPTVTTLVRLSSALGRRIALEPAAALG
jgi:DNA-binding XRE family transcriptional regulator